MNNDNQKIKPFDVVTFKGVQNAKYKPLHQAERLLLGEKPNNLNVPVHTGIAIPGGNGKVKIVDIAPGGVKAHDMNHYKGNMKVKSITRLNLSPEEKVRLYKDITSDMGLKGKVHYNAIGMITQNMLKPGTAKGRGGYCSEYVAKKINKNTRYKTTIPAGQVKPKDWEHPAVLAEKGKGLFKTPSASVIAAKPKHS